MAMSYLKTYMKLSASNHRELFSSFMQASYSSIFSI